MVNKIIVMMLLICSGAGFLSAKVFSAETDPVEQDYAFVNGWVVSDANIDLLDFNQVDIVDVLKLISLKVNRNIVANQSVRGRVSVYLRDVSLLEALKVIMGANGWAFVEEGSIIRVMTAQEYEEQFGQKFGQVQETYVHKLNFGNTSAVAVMLNQIKSAQGKVLVDEKSGTLVITDSLAKLAEMKKILVQVDVATETVVFDLGYIAAKDMAAQLTPILTPVLGSLKSDDRSNRVVVTDIPRVLEQTRGLVEAFDARHKEVLIQAKIVQVILNDEHKMGVDWEGLAMKFKKLTFKSSFSILADTEKRGSVSVGALSDDDFTLMLQMLDTVGTTNILSSPRITALNNEEAKILVGSTEPYVTSTTTTPSSGPSTTAESVNFIDVGVKLYVTPTIHNDGFITVKIKPEVSSSTGKVTTSNNNTIPIVETSEAETKVMVKDGVTIILGGLIKEEKIVIDKRVPFLGSIPVLKTAFSSRSNSVRKTEIAIFLKPTIISGDVDDFISPNMATTGY